MSLYAPRVRFFVDAGRALLPIGSKMYLSKNTRNTVNGEGDGKIF